MAKQKLQEYNEKRDFSKTAEPSGREASSPGDLRFVVQKHDATRLHYDFRLEHDGVLWSWAVPKGPSYDPRDKRLAVRVEDHPLDYRNFEGTIPKGEYGGGTVLLFDEGTWEPLVDPVKGMAEGSLKLALKGERLKGNWALVKMKAKDGEEDKNWLLIKEKDDRVRSDPGIDGFTTSVRSGRTMEEIAGDVPGTSPETKESAKKAKNISSQRTPGRKKTGNPEDGPAPDPEKPLRPADPSAPLPFRSLKPMLATLVKTLPSGDEWVHEIKFDGYRILCFLENGKATLRTRSGLDWTERLPLLRDLLEKWDPGNLVLDGEVVILDADGKSDFQALQGYFRDPGKDPPDYVVFDLPALGDQDLRSRPLKERKALLQELLENAPAGLHFSFHTPGSTIFSEACGSGMEGVISKKLDSPYRSTRSRDWVKLKCEHRQEFVIGGYTVTEKNTGGISSLLLGIFEDEELIYRGRAGTGIDEAAARDLLSRFTSRKTSPFRDEPKPRSGETLNFVTPALAAEIRFAELTEEGLLRQASFKGIREDKSVREIRVEGAAGSMDEGKDSPKNTSSRKGRSSAKEPTRKTGGEGLLKKAPSGTVYGSVTLSSPDRIVFPEEELAKKDAADYYWAVQDLILPYLIDRPVTLIRCSDSIGGECFFQKHMNQKIQGMETRTIADNEGKTSEIMVLGDAEGLMGAVQMGAIEFHTWGTVLSHLEQPDWLVFDLDPDEGMELDSVREGVRDLRSLLDALELESFLKTSGGKGYHITVPLSPSAPWDKTREFAKLLALSMEQKWPDRYTANMRKEKRRGRIYIDWVRNNRSATSVSAFSLRSRKGAPLSWPLRWEDLNKVAPGQVKLANFRDYLNTLTGWDGFHDLKQSLRG